MDANPKMLPELCAFILAGARGGEQLKQIAEMIRNERDYRWVGIYKIKRCELIIAAGTGDDPPAYPRFPVTQGLCGAAAEARETIIVPDVTKDSRYLPTFGSTRSEILVPIMTERDRVAGVIAVESEKLNAFSDDDREFLERVASLLPRALK